MYKEIVVPVAFDDEHDPTRAIAVARMLAEDGARITLLHVMEAIPAFAVSYMPEGFRDELRDTISGRLAEIAQEIPGGESLVMEGHSGATILEYAKMREADLIVIDSHRPGMADLLLGSTAARVVRHAACGVHVLR